VGSFSLLKDLHRKDHVVVQAGEPIGVMYGLLELSDQVQEAVRLQKLGWKAIAMHVRTTITNARFEYRALKFNLPISAYRTGESTRRNYADCRDLAFWEKFLDMMAQNRFNVLTLWALHPWPFMVTPKNFSKAASFSDTKYWGGPGTETEADWKTFWTGLFKMAKDRGIDPYIIDWNIFLSEGYKKAYDHKAITDHDGHGGNGTITQESRRYSREVIAQTIDAYPDLAGIGITLGERMVNLGEKTSDLKEQVEWIEEVVFGALEQATRKVNLIYRAALDNKAPTTVRASIDAFVKRTKAKVWVQLKFNWSHGHSTTKLIHAHGGGTGAGYWQPAPTTYKMAWMVRNEDFFFVRWGQSPFIRSHIAMNGQDYVGGYITGSEEHIPATDYASLESAEKRGWKYDFERQWLYYMQWGRLLFNPQTEDAVFAKAFSLKFNVSDEAGTMLLQAYHNCSIVPLRFAAFVYSTWDATLHSEDLTDEKGFIPVDSLLTRKTLDPALESISAYVKRMINSTSEVEENSVMRDKACLYPNKCSPPALANELSAASDAALQIVDTISKMLPHRRPELDAELVDVQTWAHLGKYFALKIRGTVAYGLFHESHNKAHQAEAVANLTAAVGEWKSVCYLTSSHLLSAITNSDVPPVTWCGRRVQVEQDVDIAKKSLQDEFTLLV